MFTIEQNIAKTQSKCLKNAVLKRGTTLANKNIVKRKITYKELTLAFGIIIAVVVALTLWASKNPAEESLSSSPLVPKTNIVFPFNIKSLIESTIEVLK
jgi:hypothetical protein